MRRKSIAFFLAFVFFAGSRVVHTQTSRTNEASEAPLRLESTLELPASIAGNFDHFGIDIKRNRLFATPEDSKSVFVFDLSTGKVAHVIQGIARPHAVLYRADVDRLYVTDGGDGQVRVFNGATYEPLQQIALLKDADSIGFDLSRKRLYVDNGGGDVGQKYSMLSEIDTERNTKVRDIRIDGDTLEAMALDNYRPRIYVNDAATGEVVVVDRFINKITAKWSIPQCQKNVAMALDEQRQRLFVGCRNGKMAVLDSNTGMELQVLTIHPGVDDVIYDASAQRIYASTDGFVDTFEQTDLNHYRKRADTATGAKARTELYVPQTNRLFVAVPGAPSKPAHILVFQPKDTRKPQPPPGGSQEPVHAPVAQKLVLEELSAHPLLRRMGLHVIPPGSDTMILIANGNEARLGIHTSEGDFAAVKDSKTYGPRNADGEFYNMKMPMFDAQNRRIGILVMEIACTDATSEEDAARKAERIRAELQAKIPDLNALFAVQQN
jgi:hypothetical protein